MKKIEVHFWWRVRHAVRHAVRHVHGFPRKAGQSQPGHSYFEQASNWIFLKFFTMSRCTSTRVSKQAISRDDFARYHVKYSSFIRENC